MYEELKPCPFCGNTKLKIDRKSVAAGYTGLEHRVEHHTYSVRCNTCHARGGAIGGKVIPYFNLWKGEKLEFPTWAETDDELKRKSIEAWNRRTAKLPKPPKEE